MRKAFNSIWILFAAARLLLARAGPAGDPAAELASFQIANGFEINLFAAETNSAAGPWRIHFDPRGQLCLVETRASLRGESAVSDARILLLEDNDGDGQCDKRAVLSRRAALLDDIDPEDGRACIVQGLLRLETNPGTNGSVTFAVDQSRDGELPPSLVWRNGQSRPINALAFVGTAHFPPVWQGVLLTAESANRAIWALKIADDGSGLVFEPRQPFLTSANPEFQPVDIQFAPDGALFVLDWRGPATPSSGRRNQSEPGRARVWRITAKDRPLSEPPRLADAPVAELLVALNSPDRWTRESAARVLSSRPAKDVVGAIKHRLPTWTGSADGLREAMTVLERHEGLDETLIRQLARASAPGAADCAARAVALWADRLNDPISILRPLVKDESARVRLHAILACGKIPSPAALDLLAAAAELPTDRFIDCALKRSVKALEPFWMPAIESGRLNLAASPSHLTLLLRADPAAALEALRSMDGAPLDAEQQMLRWRTLLQHGGATDLERILGLPDLYFRWRLVPDVLSAVKSRNLPSSPRAEELLRVLIQANHPDAFRLAGHWRAASCQAPLEAAARDPLLDPEIRGVAVSALAGINLDRAAALAAEAGAWLDRDAVWREIFLSFFQREHGAAALARAFRSRKPPPRVAALALRLLEERPRETPSTPASGAAELVRSLAEPDP